MISPSSNVNPYFPPTEAHRESEEHIHDILRKNNLNEIVDRSLSNEDNLPWQYWYNLKADMALKKISSELLRAKENISHSDLQIFRDQMAKINKYSTNPSTTGLYKRIFPEVEALYDDIPQINISSHIASKLVETGPYIPPNAVHARAEEYLDDIDLRHEIAKCQNLNLKVTNHEISWQDAYNSKLAEVCLFFENKENKFESTVCQLSCYKLQLEKAYNCGTNTKVRKYGEDLRSIEDLYNSAQDRLEWCRDELSKTQISESNGRSIPFKNDPPQENNEVKTETLEESKGRKINTKQSTIFTFHPDSVKKKNNPKTRQL